MSAASVKFNNNFDFFERGALAFVAFLHIKNTSRMAVNLTTHFHSLQNNWS